MTRTGFFGGPIGGTSLDIPDDRNDWLVPIPQRGFVTAKQYGSEWLVGDGYPTRYDATAPALETARYVRQRYWWPLGVDSFGIQYRWEGSCMVHEDMRPTGVGLGLALVAWLTGYARFDHPIVMGVNPRRGPVTPTCSSS